MRKNTELQLNRLGEYGIISENRDYEVCYAC